MRALCFEVVSSSSKKVSRLGAREFGQKSARFQASSTEDSLLSSWLAAHFPDSSTGAQSQPRFCARTSTDAKDRLPRYINTRGPWQPKSLRNVFHMAPEGEIPATTAILEGVPDLDPTSTYSVIEHSTWANKRLSSPGWTSPPYKTPLAWESILPRLPFLNLFTTSRSHASPAAVATGHHWRPQLSYSASAPHGL
jgi:hypothetical protein